MIGNVSERVMHRVRWLLTLGWFLLITSMFYDPVTPRFTEPGGGTVFSLNPDIYLNPEACVKLRDVCIPEQTFSMSPLIWWAMIVPAGILILMSFGHEAWRRICPLSFVSQIPRALGIQRRKKVRDRLTGESRYEVPVIKEDSWLGQNHLYVQWGLFTLGLGARILFVNGDRIALGIFLIGTIVCAIWVGYLFAGKSWCQYFCPMAPVQMVYTGPRSLLGGQPHLAPGKIGQSMCRTVEDGVERSACVQCNAPCIDIDSEKAYWQELKKPGRRLVQYGYLGMVIAFYFYYYLYSGNWKYYFSGAWTHEEDLLSKLFDPGFYIAGVAIPIPKAIAVFITYFIFTGATFTIGLIFEKLYRRIASVSAVQAQHVTFSLFTLVSFWTFFSYGARPSLNRLPQHLVLGFNGLVVLLGALWFYRTIRRSHFQYDREKEAVSLRKQLHRLNPPESVLRGRTIEELTPDEVFILIKAATSYSQQARLNSYKELVVDLLEQGAISGLDAPELERLQSRLGISREDHFETIKHVTDTHRHILVAAKSVQHEKSTVVRPVRVIAAGTPSTVANSRRAK